MIATVIVGSVRNYDEVVALALVGLAYSVINPCIPLVLTLHAALVMSGGGDAAGLAGRACPLSIGFHLNFEINSSE